MPSDVLQGEQIAGCRIDALAGRGGMGIVYRATQLSLGRPVAVKLIAPDRAADPNFRERFERESRLAAAIDHPNVIPVYEAGDDDGRLYLVMRWVEGADLSGLLRRTGRLEPHRAAAIAEQVAGALDAAHEAGLVHRDVKPANVLLSGDHAYLADFGLTRPIVGDRRLTSTGQWLGTADYMAPEQFDGDVADARTDVYALGCVLYAMLTGEPPYRRDTLSSTVLAHLHEPPPRPSRTANVPEAFDSVIARALAKRPEDRFPSAGDLGRAAHEAADGRTARGEEHSVARGEAAPRPTAATRKMGAAAPKVGVAGPTAVTSLVEGRTRRAPAPAPEQPVAAPRKVSAPGRRRRVAIFVLAFAALAIAGAVVGLVLNGEEDAPPPGTPVSENEVRAAAQNFATAYANEDGDALGRLFTNDVQRVTPGSKQTGRREVVAAYERQFANSATRGFTFGDLEVEGGPAGRAEAHYKATYAGAPAVNGRLVLRVIRDRGRVRIALVAATPGG